MDIARYLERLHYTGDYAADLRTLRALHRAHMLIVPFENLDIPLKRPIVLDEAALSHKVIDCHRGGFCYELNGLFAALLREIGFQVDLLSARVWTGDGFGQDFDHLTLRVHLQEDWLADVGFGDCFMEPIRFADGEAQTVEDKTYRLVSQDDHHWILEQQKDDQTWTPEYLFSTTPHILKDFEAMCEWQQTSPDSHFTKGRVISRATEDGRVTLRDQKLIITQSGAREEQPLADEDAVTDALQEHFGVDLALR